MNKRTLAMVALVNVCACGGDTGSDAGGSDAAMADRVIAVDTPTADHALDDTGTDAGAMDAARDVPTLRDVGTETPGDDTGADATSDTGTDATSDATSSEGGTMVGDTCSSSQPCASGFQCVSGMCRTESAIGEPCGGSIRFPPVCAPGSHCEFPDVIVIGGHGTCEPDGV